MRPRRRSTQPTKTQFKTPPVRGKKQQKRAVEEVSAPRRAWGRLAPEWADEHRLHKQAWIAAGLLGLLALLLRLPTLATRSLWFDEIHTLTDAYWVRPEGQTHWLFFRIVGIVTDLLGESPLAIRLYPALAGVVGVIVLTLWVWRMGGLAPAVLAGVALAVSPTHVEFSQEGRYYAPMVLFATLALWSATEVFVSEGKERWAWLVGTVAACWLGWTNHITSGVLAGALAVWMAGCVVATPWGRRMTGRIILGTGPRWRLRLTVSLAVLALLVMAAIWKGWPLARGYVSGLQFDEQTPNVEWSEGFFRWNLRRFGAAVPLRGFWGALAWLVFEGGFVAGLVWLFWRRAAWGVLTLWTLSLTFFMVFSYRVEQAFSPKYIAFLYPLRLFAMALGWAACLAWATGRIRALGEAKRRTLAIGTGALLIVAIAVPELWKQYTRARQPIRPAMVWLKENTNPDEPVFSYGHSNYGVEYYAPRLEMNLDRFHLLRWPSETGNLDLGMIRAHVPVKGSLYFLAAWPYDLPKNLEAGLKRYFEESARFPSSQGRELDTVVYRWAGEPPERSGPTLTIPALQVSRRGWMGETQDTEYQGRDAVRFLQNNWAEYDVRLEPGEVYELGIVGFDDPEGPAYLEVDLDGEFAGVIGFARKSGTWMESGFAFRARESTTRIRVRLISEVSNGAGDTSPGIGVAIAEVKVSRQDSADASALRDNRVELSRLVTPLGENQPAYADPDNPGLPAPEWLQNPGAFDVSLAEEAGSGRDDGRESLRVHLLPPYDGSTYGPLFPVQPDKILYLTVPVRVNEVYRVGASLFVALTGPAGQINLFPSEGGLEEKINWDFVYRAFEGENRKEYTFFFMAPEGYDLGTLGVLAWPHPVPERTPAMELILEPPITPDRNPDLLNR